MPDKLYLKPDQFKKSAVHTHYYGTGAVTTNTNDPHTIKRLEFQGGVATNVPDEVARQAEAEGIATRTRPRRRDED